MEEGNKQEFGRFEDLPVKSEVQIIDQEIKMVKRNRFLSEQEKSKQICKLLEAKNEYK
ncbi:hypothetical protein ACFOWA_19945 [Pedobacter lithocola]|uniref:Transposase n=1 Tax=Pedobacter lithocola TaxID=1908239 RepID=A0ABV8PGW0_9SPHI